MDVKNENYDFYLTALICVAQTIRACRFWMRTDRKKSKGGIQVFLPAYNAGGATIVGAVHVFFFFFFFFFIIIFPK